MSLKDSGQYYHEVLKRIPPRDLPAFEDESMQERVWGRRWGVYNDVGPLKTVLVHRPGEEIAIMTADKYDPSIEALIDESVGNISTLRQRSPPLWAPSPRHNLPDSDAGRPRSPMPQRSPSGQIQRHEVVRLTGPMRRPGAPTTCVGWRSTTWTRPRRWSSGAHILDWYLKERPLR